MRRYYVYKVTNKVNNKVYVGRTFDFFRRLTQHCKESESETSQLHMDFKNYGIENFVWEVLCVVDDKYEADKKEKEYIRLFGCLEPNGYNKTAGGTSGVLWDTKPILCFEKDGTFIKKYESASQTIKDGFFIHGVIDCCDHKAISCHDKVFMYEEEFLKSGFVKREKNCSSVCHPVVQCDLFGNFIAEYDSVIEASRNTGIGRSSISSNLIGQRKTTGGYIFVYKEDYPIKDLNSHSKRQKGIKIACINPETNERVAIYNSIAEAGRSLNVNYKAIQRIVDRDNRTAFGYKWKTIS